MTDGVTNAGQWPDEGALERWMADHVEGFRGPVSLSKFEGGQSNPTFRIEAGKITSINFASN